MNIRDLNSLIIKILRYSAIKIRAKVTLLYSVLKPETSSDSPSAKSNGVRLVSAKVLVNQIKNKGINMKIHPTLLYSYISMNLNLLNIIKHLIKIKDILTS